MLRSISPSRFRGIFIFSAGLFLFFSFLYYSNSANRACATENFSPQSISLVGHSMEPTLPDGSALSLLSGYYHSCPFAHGDLIGIEFDTFAGHQQYVKRIIAIPGDRVSFSPENNIILNGVQLFELYAQGSLSSADVNRLQIVLGVSRGVIPAHFVLVLGDNRSSSFDSRAFGLVHENSIVGKVLFPAS